MCTWRRERVSRRRAAARCAARSPSGLGIDAGAYVVDGFSLNKLFFWLFSSFPTSSRNPTVYVRPAGRLPRPPSLLPHLACCPRAAGRRALRGLPSAGGFPSGKIKPNLMHTEKERREKRKKEKEKFCVCPFRAGQCWKAAGEAASRPLAASPGQSGGVGTRVTGWALSRRVAGRSRGGGHFCGLVTSSVLGEGSRSMASAAWEPSLDSADSCGSGFTAPVTGPQPQPPCSPACGALSPHWSPGSWS